MRSLEVELPEETAESVAAEADILGFDSPSAYVRWVVSRRFDIDDGSELAATLEEHAGRAREPDGSGHGETAGGSDCGGPDAPPDDDAPPPTGGRPPADDPTGDAGATSEEQASASPNDELVERVVDRSLDDAAAALSSVEESRIDVFARRALTQTRKRLGEDVGTGIDYDAREGAENAPPGAEITDLDAIEVPGHDDGLVARRRVAVGAALAFLKDAQSARRSDFVDALFDDYPAGYETADSWWQCIKRGLRQVDRVKPADENSRIWGFRTTPGRVRRISYS
ncbi:MAG: hypothetical protein V5A44_01515 [Haloarculaceae archaeon]